MLPSAQAQLWQSPLTTASQPVLKGFAAQDDGTWRSGEAVLEIDRIGQRTIGLWMRAPKDNTDAVSRGIAAALGMPEEALPEVKAMLDDPEFQAAFSAQGFLQDVEGASIRLRLKKNEWLMYTALNASEYFPATTPPPLGDKDARVRIDVISDFQCPYCAQLWQSEAMAKWREKPELYRINYHHFPLESIHPMAMTAATHSDCVARQGKFWDFADRVYNNFARWTKLPEDEQRAFFTEQSKQLGLKEAEMKSCLAEDHATGIRATQQTLQERFFVRGTPTVLVNGMRVNNYNDASEIRRIRAVTEAGEGAVKIVQARLATLE